MLDLPPPPWGDQLQVPGSNGAGSGIHTLLGALSQQRLSRELGLGLRKGIRAASADFSYMRLEGLKRLDSLIAASSATEECLTLFQSSQAYLDLQIVTVLFEHTLCPPKRLPIPTGDPITVDPPPRIVCPASEEEILAALHVLEGCCLLDPSSRVLAAHSQAIKDILERLVVGSAPVRCGCLDALLALLLDNPENQSEFCHAKGLERVVELLKNRNVVEAVRMKSAEFLLILLAQVLPRTPSSADEAARVADRAPITAASVENDLEKLLPHAASAFLVRALKSGIGANPELSGPESIQAAARELTERVK